MTATQPARRPSPHPTIVTDGDPAACNAGPGTPPSGPPVQEKRPGRLHFAITVGKQTWEWLQRIEPPVLLADRQPAVEEIRAYAHQSAYTNNGALRALGIAWCYTVAIPVLVTSRLFAWVCERPVRFFITAATVKLLTFLPPAGWVADHLITPAITGALHLFL